MKLKGIIGSLKPERVKNIRVITLCILAAGTFWFLNALNDTYSTTIRYPIEFLYDKNEYIALEELPDEIQLNVSGVGWNLFRNNLGLKEAPIQFRLDRPSELNNIAANTLLGTISDQLTEFQVNFILTDTLYINIDNKIERSFALAVDSIGIDLESNYWITTTILHSPDSVLLQGPESILGVMSDSLIVTIPLKGIDKSYNEDIPIEVANGQLIHRNPPTINVRFGVEEYVNASKVIPITKVNFPEDSSANLGLEQALIIYQVGITSESSLTDDSFQLIADYSALNNSDSTLTLTFQSLPEEVKNVKIDSSKVKVIFNNEQ